MASVQSLAETKLRFIGELPLWVGIVLAVAGAGLAFRYYLRELGQTRGARKYFMPALRAGAIFLILMILTGPVLKHRHIEGQLGRVFVFVDGSESMSLDDPSMPVVRKLLVAQQQGILPKDTVDTTLFEAAELMALARVEIENLDGRDEMPNRQELSKVAGEIYKKLKQAHEQLSKVDPAIVPATDRRNGALLHEVWANVDDQNISALVRDQPYGRLPTRRGYRTSFDTPPNAGDRYGQRLSGFITPPITGRYVFELSSDDASRLFLSTDPSRQSRKQIARIDTYVPRGQWVPSGRSVTIDLVAGQSYYIEAIHVEGSGEDHLSVGWRRPDGRAERPIPGIYLSAPLATQSNPASSFTDMVKGFRKEVVDQSNEIVVLSARVQNGLDDTRRRLAELGRRIGRYERFSRYAFEGYGLQLAARQSKAIRQAIADFDSRNRWDRVERLLTAEDNGLVAQLAETHEIQLVTLNGLGTERIWSGTGEANLPDSIGSIPAAAFTDLSTGLSDRVAENSDVIRTANGPERQRTAIVLMSDGHDNHSRISTDRVARLLHQGQIPIISVGFGANHPPHDLAVIGVVDSPESVFHEDRMRGTILLKDHMPAGKAFTVRIEDGDKVVWEKNLITQNLNVDRRVKFDFSVKKILEQYMARAHSEVTINSLPLSMRVKVVPLDGEMRKDNNETRLDFRADRRTYRVLLVDGRPRWESRYIRNLLDRDRRWKVDTVFAGPASDSQALRRGSGADRFPVDKKGLFQYDLIIFGEVARGILRDEELNWMEDFVGKRGGGIIFLDGRRRHLRHYHDTPLASMLPVEWLDDVDTSLPQRLQLTSAGQERSEFQFLAGAENANLRLWHALPTPRRVSPVRQLPGSQVFLEAIVDDQRVPVLVYRSFGAGKVLFSGHDESWRWRYEVADRYHARYWGQVAAWIKEDPFSASDKYVSLDAGKPTYMQGKRAQIRVRVRDADGDPLEDATVHALIRKKGTDTEPSMVELQSAEGSGGLYFGQSPELPEGDYEVSVGVTGLDEDEMKAVTQFSVIAASAGEMARLDCNEALLRNMATTSGGQYLREEQAGQLADILRPLSRGRIIEAETLLWQSYWWFVPVIILLTIEWLLRKRAGML